jgi:chromatin segregation and condensation protein Rec8/ScpA/Scc1 (kleisin family)
MMSQSVEKPFYFQPPLSILFEIHRLEKVMPWDVNISFLLTTFLEEMEQRGEIDFRASGVALESSSIIYLMKSKLLLELQEPPPPPKSPPDFLPPPMFLPLRYELSSTTLENLLDVLDEVLRGERVGPSLPAPPPPILPTPEIIPPVDLYLVEIETRMKTLYSQLCLFAKKAELVGFAKLVAGLEKLEAVKTFIVLLFLAQRGKIGLWQEDDISELYITVTGDPAYERRRTGII